MSFADRLKQARKRQGLTQEELAKKSGLATPTVQNYEYGKITPRKNTVAKLANSLNLGYAYTNSNEPYFYAFVDAAPNTSPMYVEATKFNDSQYEDAISNAIKDVGNNAHYRLDLSSASLSTMAKLFSALTVSTNDLMKAKLVDDYDALNDDGKEKLCNYAIDLLRIKEYRNNDTQD